MADYGVTDAGFVIKRLDTIMEEVHSDLTDGFGTDTRLLGTSFLNTMVTTFCNQIAELWETAQDSYYAKYPSTATGINLDNAVQYGGIRRTPDKQTVYPLHCTGDDGTVVHEQAVVATNTKPEVRLTASEEFEITRDSFNEVSIIVSAEQNALYSVEINGIAYSYQNKDGDAQAILEGLKNAINNAEYEISVNDQTLAIKDTVKTRKNALVLSDNLTTSSVTTIANFATEDYGKITLPTGIVTKFVENIAGFTAVTNILSPTYGRLEETDIELRQSYLVKSALRSNTMIESITSELLNNVADIESASGYENDTDETDERGLPPHSIEIVVEGGADEEIASAILMRKAGGIQTYGSVTVNIPGVYGDSIPVHFNRPEYLYTWMKVILHGDSNSLPLNYAALTTQSLLEDGDDLCAGSNLLVQLLDEGIYSLVAGLTYVDILTAYSGDSSFVPEDSDYKKQNIIVTSRQKVVLSESRIEVSFVADT